MDPTDYSILVRFRYFKRQQLDWDETAPMIGEVAGLTRHAEWRFVRQFPAADGGRPGQAPVPTPPPTAGIDESRDPPVTFLRGVLYTCDGVVRWLEDRANEGVKAQYNLSHCLADILLLYKKGAEELADRLERLAKAGYRGL